MIVKATATTIVTEAQLARCHRVIDLNTMLPFYKVESERDSLVEYKVATIWKQGRWHVTCSCPAGLRGIACKHRRWARAAAAEYKAELAEQARRDAEKAERQRLYQVLNIGYASPNVSNEDLARIAERNKRPAPTHYPCIQARPFSIL